MSHGSDIEANALMVALVGETNATLPEIDLSNELHTIPWGLDNAVYKTVEKLDPSVITSKQVDGTGIFDVMMSGFAAHLEDQFKKGYISQSKYADVYVALTQVAMQNAVQFALGKDQAFWAAARAQADAITAKVNNEAVRIQAMTGRAQYALTKIQLAKEDSAFAQSEFQLEEILPKQAMLVSEQAEAQRAQTMDTRSGVFPSGGGPVEGLLGQQKALYAQQVQSYKEDVKLKAAKVFMDTWVTQKTISESTEPSGYFTARDPANPGTAQALDGIFKAIRISAMGEDDDYVPTYP